MPSERIVTELKLLGHRAYVSGMQYASSSTASLDTATSRLGRTAGSVGGYVDTLGQKLWTLGRYTGIAVGAMGAAAVTMGIEFNANMERAEVGMETLLKSGKLARRTVENVRDFALKAPLFGVEQMMTSAQQLIGAGYDAKKIVPLLTTFSDTLSAMGRKPEDLQRMTYAFVQMMSKGQISAEELRGQLGEIFPAQRTLAKEMGMTSKELADKMKEGAIKGKKPLLALLTGMEKEFGGGTAKMAGTFTGMWANIRESTKYTMGVLFEPLFLALRDDVFPEVQAFGANFVEVLENNNMTADQKWARLKQLAQIHFGPLARDIEKYIEDADVGGKIADALDAALPVIMDKATEYGWKAAQHFAKAWWEADIWTKIFTGLLLLTKMGAFRAAGTAAAEIFVRRFTDTTTSPASQTKFDESGKKGGRRWGRAMGRAAGFAALAGFAYIFWPQIENQIKSFAEETKDRASGLWSGLKDIGGQMWKDWTGPITGSKGWRDLFGGPGGGIPKNKRALGGPVLPSIPYVVGERGPEIFVPRMPGQIIPDASGAFQLVVPATFNVDGKTFAKSIARTTSETMARR